ncbi:Lon protease family protein [Tissierella carlieri]|uniref:Lon protease family protein n=1 Tax=Tissierella TaxID=41273 RepID=UPI002803CB99|nr:AAA family ATPase [uncultured Tissierella sp.]MDU5080354.1 AAA family ATPase [Bacillota bacterium]
MLEKYKVPVEKLRNQCDPNIFPHETTEEWIVDRELIGQDRAMEALKYGLSMKRKGYNIYVSGFIGTGRNSYSYLVAEEFAKKKPTPCDWCYVYNFKKPNCPKAINLPSGKGIGFKQEIESAIKNIETEIPRALSSKDYEDSKNAIFNENKKVAESILMELNNFAKEYSFVFKQTDRGILSIPLIDNRPMTDEELEKLSDDEMDRLGDISIELTQKSYDYIKRIKAVETKLKNEIKRIKEEQIVLVATTFIGPIQVKYRENEGITSFLLDMKEDIVKNYEMFLDNEEENYVEKIFLQGNKKEDFLKRYSINLFIDNSYTQGAPVIREMNPNYYNLFGKIEYANEMGVAKTDHTRIKPGSMHEANGGYILIQAKDILQNRISWEGLKRTITTEELKVENIYSSNLTSETLNPEAIPLDIKIIIIGDYITYHILYAYDEEFKKIFRIRADFDTEMERNEENILKIGSFVAYQCKEENLLPFHREALGAIIDLSSRIADEKNKLTASFNELVEIIYEADGWASSEYKKVVTKEDVEKAILKKQYRNNSYEEKLLELINNETILIDTQGEKVGEINGLSVIDLGQYSFGRPTKITANTYFGKDGIINIEKETEQSGNIHDKGVLIMSGYLGEKYAQNIQLSMTASITFEQSYDGIDGDSASSTELYAILSSLGDIPVKQGIAVTGSVNQKGKIQPIGGVNEKIEGFYKICKIKGFKGGEGVIIPSKNIENLMLNDEVIMAVKDGKFTIYAIDTIDEGMEILTGIKAGELNESGEYEENTINAYVQEKLIYYAMLDKELEE